MARIGTEKFAQNVVKVGESQFGYTLIVAGEETWWVVPREEFQSNDLIRSAVVEQFVAQGYRIAAVSGKTTTLQLDNRNAPEDPGLTTRYKVENLAQVRGQAATKVNSEKSGQCFIATACYGDCDHPDVVALRRWRDSALLPNPVGRSFVRCYYAISPSIADRIGRLPRIASLVRRHVLKPIVRRLN